MDVVRRIYLLSIIEKMDRCKSCAERIGMQNLSQFNSNEKGKGKRYETHCS